MTPTYTLFFARPAPNSSTWTVCSEEYARIEDAEPIEGSLRIVASCVVNEDRAIQIAAVHQRRSFVSSNK